MTISLGVIYYIDKIWNILPNWIFQILATVDPMQIFNTETEMQNHVHDQLVACHNDGYWCCDKYWIIYRYRVLYIISLIAISLYIVKADVVIIPFLYSHSLLSEVRQRLS